MAGKSLRIAAVLFLCVSGQVLAHHSFTSEFNPNQVRNIQGTITEVSWTNPHVSLKVAEKNVASGSTVWTVRGDSPSTLGRSGWSSRTFAVGQQLVVCGYEARGSAGVRELSGEQVELPGGRRLVFSTTNIKTCLTPKAMSNPTRPTANPVGTMTNPIPPIGNPIGPIGNPVGPVVSSTR